MLSCYSWVSKVWKFISLVEPVELFLELEFEQSYFNFIFNTSSSFYFLVYFWIVSVKFLTFLFSELPESLSFFFASSEFWSSITFGFTMILSILGVFELIFFFFEVSLPWVFSLSIWFCLSALNLMVLETDKDALFCLEFP